MSAVSVLNRIAQKAGSRLEERKRLVPESRLRERCKAMRNPHPFSESLDRHGVNVIAEIKFSSPSQGEILASRFLTPVEVAREYLQNGAQALSVLTEQDYFHGHPCHLSEIRAAFPGVPLLMKDFIIEEYQLIEARILGADCVLLIVSLLGRQATMRLLRECRALGLSALVEVHDDRDLEIALDLGADLIGVNNRNLKTLEVSLETSFGLAKIAQMAGASKSFKLVSESGISRRSEVDLLRLAGFSGFLVGTSFMKTGAPGKALAELLSGDSR